MGADFSELMQLAADLEAGPDILSQYVRKAVQVTSIKVKKDSQESVRGRKGLSHAASAISYETSESPAGVSAEIGYDKGKKAGALGNLIEFGAPNAKKHMVVNGKNFPVPPGGISQPLAPSHDLGNALLNNEDDFVHGLGKAVADSLRDVGL